MLSNLGEAPGGARPTLNDDSGRHFSGSALFAIPFYVAGGNPALRHGSDAPVCHFRHMGASTILFKTKRQLEQM